MVLNYFSCGEGFPLVILHGLLGSSDNWQTLGKKFGERFKVFAVDLRNHGSSPHSDIFEYPSMAEDLREFMDAQNISETYLLGHSMGGKVAMQFAATRPERVKKLIVADIGIKEYPPHHAYIFDALLSLDLARFESRTELDKALATKISEAPLRSFLLKNVTRDNSGKFIWKINLPTIHEKYRNITAALNFSAPIVRPTLFIRGTNSDYILPEDETSIRKFFPASEFVTIDGAGHWLHAEKPEEFFKQVTRFTAV